MTLYGEQASGPAPVCPRHPDRVSYVRCQRCGRPVCVECQRPAPVGVLCVDCYEEGARAAPRYRTTLGGRDRGGRPVVTAALIGACVAVFLLSQVFPQLRSAFAFAPVVGFHQPYRFVTAAFLHAGFLHIAFNMYALWVIGSFLEAMLGRWRFLALFLLSAIGGSVAVLLLADPDGAAWFTPVVGASGAVFGAFGAILMVLRRTGRDASQIVVLIAVNLALGFIAAGISWQAHVGGLVTGLFLGTVFAYAPRGSRTLLSLLAIVGVALGLALLALGAYL